MKLIYEKSQAGRRASSIPRHENLPAPEVPDELRRNEPPRLPEVPEFELIRHFTERRTVDEIERLAEALESVGVELGSR